MKQSFLIILFLAASIFTYATDLLIFGQDTFYLKTYPLEFLHLKHRPFGLTIDEVTFNNSYPGYQAVWRIDGEKLYLERIVSMNSDLRDEENVGELLKKNGIKFSVNNEMFFADWLSITCYAIEPHNKTTDKPLFLGGSYEINASNEKALLRIEKGFIKINKLPKCRN